MEPIPNIKKTYAMIIKEKSHQNLTKNAEIRQESVAFIAPRIWQNKIQCTHCFKHGYEAKSFYQLVGYLEWWLERKLGIVAGSHSSHVRFTRCKGHNRGVGRDVLGASPSSFRLDHQCHTLNRRGRVGRCRRVHRNSSGFPNCSVFLLLCWHPWFVSRLVVITH